MNTLKTSNISQPYFPASFRVRPRGFPTPGTRNRHQGFPSKRRPQEKLKVRCSLWFPKIMHIGLQLVLPTSSLAQLSYMTQRRKTLKKGYTHRGTESKLPAGAIVPEEAQQRWVQTSEAPSPHNLSVFCNQLYLILPQKRMLHA